MAIEMFSESPSLTSSPRISFSHNLHQTDGVQSESYPFRSDTSLLLDLNPDFDFNNNLAHNQPPSTADELFSGGQIRPLQLHQRFTTPKSAIPGPEISNPDIVLSEQKHHSNNSKSFWKIKRSSSLHCESGDKKSSFWVLPRLSRSNSTGSVNVPKQKQGKSSLMAATGYGLTQKPPLKRNYGGAYDYGVRVSPVLNVPPPFISKGAASMLGFGSLFKNGRDKKNKK